MWYMIPLLIISIGVIVMLIGYFKSRPLGACPRCKGTNIVFYLEGDGASHQSYIGGSKCLNCDLKFPSSL